MEDRRAEEDDESTADDDANSPSTGEAVRDFFAHEEIFQRVLATAKHECGIPNKTLFLSGIAAGLSLGISMLARGAIYSFGGDDPALLLANLVYPLGFVFVILGRYQLFTENTLTPVILVLDRQQSVLHLLKIWSLVLAGNLVGVAGLALLMAKAGVLSDPAAAASLELAHHAIEPAWWPLFWKGVVAGTIVAMMAWLVHAARDSTTRFLIVFALMFVVPTAELAHCIVGAGEAFYLLFVGEGSVLPLLGQFFVPVLLGNTIGGVVFVALLNFALAQGVDEP